jgi:hypothetical protein
MYKTKNHKKKINIANKTRKNTKCANNIPAVDKDIKAIIDISAIKNNIKYLKKKTGTDLMPVLKADAYSMKFVIGVA